MSGGEDVDPPFDGERRRRTPIRITLTASILMSCLAAIVPAAVTMGIYKQRIENIEKTSDQQAAILARLDSTVSELRIANAESHATTIAIFQRLDSIDRKIEDRR